MPPLEFTVIVADREVRPVGLNFTAILQAEPGAIGTGHWFVWLKYCRPVPVKTIAPKLTFAVPVLEAVMGKYTGPPYGLEHVSVALVGESVSTGVGAVPVPVSATVKPAVETLV